MGPSTQRAVHVRGQRAGNKIESFSINRETGALSKLNEVSSAARPGAHLGAPSGRFALMANFGSGHAAALSIGADGRLGAPIEPQQRGAGGHMAIDDGQSGKFVFVPLKNSSVLAQFRFDEATGRSPQHARRRQHRQPSPHGLPSLRPLRVRPHRGGRQPGLAEVRPGPACSPIRSDPAAPSGNGAHIAMHPTRELLFVCIRAYNSVATFKINPDGRPEKVGETRAGLTPRGTSTSTAPAELLLVANDGNSTVKVFRIRGRRPLTRSARGRR